jgi:hypothetical protein
MYFIVTSSDNNSRHSKSSHIRRTARREIDNSTPKFSSVWPNARLHRQAFEWLDDQTREDTRFFGVVIRQVAPTHVGQLW